MPTDRWQTGEIAVNVFERYCLDLRWVFVRVPQERDFGKDGYVDVADADGRFTGAMFAVQAKGGTSWRASGGYRIPVEDHGDLWHDSPIPVIGVVHDPDDDHLRWVNLTAELRRDPEQASILVPSEAVLADDRQRALLLDTLGDLVAPSLPMDLGSRGVRSQLEALWDSFAIARRDERALVALRHAFLAFEHGAQQDAILALSFCTPHPDVVWTADNSLPPPVKNLVCATFRWHVTEVWRLLERVDGEHMFQRGSLGQCIYMLIFEDPDAVEKLHDVAVAAAHLDAAVADRAVALYLNRCGEDAPAAWRRLLDEQPELLHTEYGLLFEQVIRDHGWVALD